MKGKRMMILGRDRDPVEKDGHDEHDDYLDGPKKQGQGRKLVITFVIIVFFLAIAVYFIWPSGESSAVTLVPR